MTTRTLDMANVIASDVTIAGDKTLSGDITFSGDVVPSTPLSHRNLIINGAMQVAQRGTSAVTANASFPVDRFLMLNNSTNGTFSAQQVAEAPSGFKNSLKVTITGADTDLGTTERLLVSYYIEGQDFISPAFGTSSAKSITLSFQVRSSLTGTFAGSLQNDNQDRSFTFEYTINAANTWESKSITISGETSGTWLTTNRIGARLRFSLGEGTDQQGTVNTWSNANYFGTSSGTSLIGTNGATWQITGVQLELGDKATPFEHRSYGDELLRCQRYYHIILTKAAGSGVLSYTRVSGSVVRGAYQLATTMRAAGTLVESHSDIIYRFNGTSSHNNNSTTPTIDIMADYGGSIDFGGFSGLPSDGQGGIIRITSGTSGAHLALSAEL